ncbi:hypothetical protein ACSBR1_043148 [Camellia fascicularis]
MNVQSEMHHIDSKSNRRDYLSAVGQSHLQIEKEISISYGNKGNEEVSGCQLENSFSEYRQRVIWSDALLIDEVLLEAALSDFSLKATCVAVKQYIDTTFSRLLLDISEMLNSNRLYAIMVCLKIPIHFPLETLQQKR